MTIVETLYLSPNQKVYVVEVSNQRFLVSAGRQEVSAPVPLDNGHSDFKSVLEQQKNTVQ